MAEQAVPPTTTMMIPVPRFIGAILGVVVTVLVSIGIYTWGTAPSFSSLYIGLEPTDAAQVIAALQSAGIPYELNAASGSVMVASGRVHEARLKLASQQEQNFGTSQFVESARYHHAMETELARTISTMRNVKSARVHLAIPKSSVFVRKRVKPSASIVLNLYGGRVIEPGQVNAIVHLTASSIASLSTEHVTVVDQNGRLLSSGDLSSNVAQTAKQFDYIRLVERNYEQRIEHLLEPIMGVGKVRATVNADIDFTTQESTEELFNNANQTVRSEQSSQSNRGGSQAGGVPGALANQPPAGGQLVEGAGGTGEAQENAEPQNTSKNSVRNYEVDRTIRHSRQGSGIVKRLTVAVLVDDKVAIEEGETTRTPLSNEEIARITTLVQQTIGFSEPRGDLVNVINASFTPIEAVEDLALKWLGPFILILILIFTPPAPLIAAPAEEEGGAGEGGTGAAGTAQLEHQQGAIPLPSDHDEKVDFAKSMVQQDPKKVANVVKDWIGDET